MANKAKAGAAAEARVLFPSDDDAAAEPPAKGMRRGIPQRNYPNLPLEKALAVARAIQDGASGEGVRRATMADLLNKSIESSAFRELLQASRAYGFTGGGATAPQFELTSLGRAATSPDKIQALEAMRQAVLSVVPYKQFLTTFDGKKLPVPRVLKEQLSSRFGVPADRAEECMQFLLADARYVGFIRKAQAGGEVVDIQGVTPVITAPVASQTAEEDDVEEDDGGVAVIAPSTPAEPPRLSVVRPVDEEAPSQPSQPKKVFIAHGRDLGTLEQVKRILDEYTVNYAVAVDEPHEGRPISAKVAGLMQDECSSAIFIFTADEHFQKTDEHGNAIDVWRPSENVVYELGAASILYDRHIVILKEKRVTLPSDFSDLGYIPFDEGQIEMQASRLFKELVALGILEVRVKG
ncbi:MAG TPA: TIR domain-containing protein [Ktedonobacterales bacterium]